MLVVAGPPGSGKSSVLRPSEFDLRYGERAIGAAYVCGGRGPVQRPDQIQVSSLGALLVRDPSAGGDRIEHIYRTDPDRPDKLSPLLRPGSQMNDGDVITAINGVSVLSVAHAGALLRDRGPVVVLCDGITASDGEAFAEGFRRLGLGKVIGVRTWGGEVWLSFSNFLADKGIASAAEMGVYGPENQWLIEGHGVDPDITVDNLPHATFEGQDAQLSAALEYLSKLVKEHPNPVPPPPPYPNKAK